MELDQERYAWLGAVQDRWNTLNSDLDRHKSGFIFNKKTEFIFLRTSKTEKWLNPNLLQYMWKCR